MLVTPRECSQVGRNSCTNAIRSIAVDPSNSSALSTLELLARDRRVSRARVESSGGGAGGGQRGGASCTRAYASSAVDAWISGRWIRLALRKRERGGGAPAPGTGAGAAGGGTSPVATAVGCGAVGAAARVAAAESER